MLSQVEDVFPITDGSIIAYSDGLHLYEQYFSLVDCLNVDKINVDAAAQNDKIEYLQVNGR